jgi:predicted ATP-dependent endonuclease of OLD family
MAKVLQELATGNSQVLITTHSPLFVAAESFEGVRLVRKDAARSEASVSSVPTDRLAAVLSAARDRDPPKAPEGLLAKIHQALQPALSEIFFTPHLVLVEGREDAAYLLTYMNLLGKADDLRRVGCHVVSADGKSSLFIPMAIVKELGIPTFLIFDADTNAPEKDGAREMHRKDNLALLRLAGIDNPDPLPAATVWGDHAVMWCTEFGREIEADFLAEDWRRLSEQVEARFGHIGGLKKNPLFIADLLEAAWSQGLKSQRLKELCNRILAFCRAA